MANYIDFEYDKKSDPSTIIVWEQNYETGKVEEKQYDVNDYLYFYIDAYDKKNAEEGITSQRGTKVTKIFASTFKDLTKGEAVKPFHDMGLNTYESDIDPILKCMLDNYGKDNQRAPKWNLALYDIETDVQTEQSFMEMREGAKQEINAVSVWYSFKNVFYELAVVPPALRSVWDYDKVEKRGNSTIIYFNNEKEMLQKFFDLNKEHEVAALGAWNGDFFDTGYIFNRAKKLWGEKGAALRMGRFPKVRKQKISIGDREEVIIRPIGMIWYDALEAYKKNGPELESFALAAVAEEEGVASKIEFEGNFEILYHGQRKDRARLDELVPPKKRAKIIKRLKETFDGLAEELHPIMWDKVKDDKMLIDPEKETRAQMLITEQLEEFMMDTEFMDEIKGLEDDFEAYILYRKLIDTFNLFLDYSIQDTQILYDLEVKLKKFDTLMMLGQYNVSSFYDVFSTLKQVEQGITNFAHLFNKKVVIDREYDKEKQEYNKYIDPELLRIRMENDYKILPDDTPEVKEMKTLVSQAKIPGAHVLMPNIGLISVDDETPELAKEFAEIRKELNEIEKMLEEFEAED